MSEHPSPQEIDFAIRTCIKEGYSLARPFSVAGITLYYCYKNFYPCEHAGKQVEGRLVCMAATARDIASRNEEERKKIMEILKKIGIEL